MVYPQHTLPLLRRLRDGRCLLARNNTSCNPGGAHHAMLGEAPDVTKSSVGHFAEFHREYSQRDVQKLSRKKWRWRYLFPLVMFKLVAQRSSCWKWLVGAGLSSSTTSGIDCVDSSVYIIIYKKRTDHYTVSLCMKIDGWQNIGNSPQQFDRGTIFSLQTHRYSMALCKKSF